MTRTDRLKTLDARSPGDDSRTQTVTLLESGARTAEAHRMLPHLAGWRRYGGPAAPPLAQHRHRRRRPLRLA
ncbi:hypothetical protein [Streptomyces sp. NBC_00893]|uniref:hypothetical protein n=1 Tax=Streptomyces sp. NBC_00893 TaxID=2975862 RepID=UPI00225B9A80|nr:hypothetical protein [Streptomyces sp. NBC_00893]MCX4851126.1 hypothetical protein [Streptomyces sp. NBC_00893]